MAIMSYLQPTAAQLQAMFEQTGIFDSYDSEGENVLLNCYDANNTKRVSVSTSYVLTFYGNNFTITSGVAGMVYGCKGALIFSNDANPSGITHVFSITKSKAGEPAIVLLPPSSVWGVNKCASVSSSASYASANQSLGGGQLYDLSITQLVPFILAPGDHHYDYTEKLYYAQIYQTYLYAGECQLDGKNYLQVGRWFALDA